MIWVQAVYFVSVLVWAVVANYHRLGGLKNRNLLLTVLKTERLGSGCWNVWLLVMFPDSSLLSVSLYGRDEKEETMSSLIFLVGH